MGSYFQLISACCDCAQLAEAEAAVFERAMNVVMNVKQCPSVATVLLQSPILTHPFNVRQGLQS